jgi:hypothetical protein
VSKGIHSFRRRRLPALVSSVFYLAGCGEAPPLTYRPLPAEIVAQPVDRSVRLELSEVWRVGHSVDPTGVEFFRVGGAAVSERGSVYILDLGNARVMEFGPGGALVREFGGEGDGPGEFRGATDLAIRHDTVLVGDQGNRVHFFALGGSILETRLLRFPDPDVHSLGFSGRSETEWVVAGIGYFNESAPEQPPVQRIHFFRLDPSSGDVEALGLRWSHESPGRYHGGFWIEPILQHRVSASLDGRGHLIVADTATYRLDILSLEGEHILRIENEVALQPIGDELIDYWRASRNCPSGQEAALECGNQRDRIILGMERPLNRPVVGRIRAHASGFFSVLRADLDPNPFDSETPSEYDHFSPDGTFIGSTSGVIPLPLDGESMIGLERDELGVESVVRYETSIN